MVKVLKVEGMMCAHCQAHVQKALEAIDGAKKVVVDLDGGTATVTMEQEIPDEKLKNAVTEAGYQVTGCARQQSFGKKWTKNYATCIGKVSFVGHVVRNQENAGCE